MTIPENQAWAMPLSDLKTAIDAETAASQASQDSPEKQQLDKAFSDFRAANPSFKYSAENTQVLFRNIAWTRVPTVDDLTHAHALATYRNTYSEPQEAQAQRPIVAPEDAYKVDMNELHDAAFGIAPKTEWDVPLEQLQQEAGIGQGPQHDPAFSMDMAELAKLAGITKGES